MSRNKGSGLRAPETFFGDQGSRMQDTDSHKKGSRQKKKVEANAMGGEGHSMVEMWLTPSCALYAD